MFRSEGKYTWFLYRCIMTFCGVCIFAALLWGMLISARASENTVLVMKTADQVFIKESPDENAATVMEVEKDTPLLIMGDADADWYQVQYQDVKGFLEKKKIVPYIDAEELDQEFSNVEQYFQSGFEQVQQSEKKERQDMMWRFVIALMAAGIAGLGVYALRTRKHNPEGGKTDAD